MDLTKAVRRAYLSVFLALVVAGVAGSATAAGFQSLLPLPPAQAPASITARPGDATVVLTWAALPDAEGYRIYRAVNGVFSPTPVASTTSLTHTSRNLANGTAYSFKVAGYTKGGNGPVSIEVTATPKAPPSGATATIGAAQTTVNQRRADRAGAPSDLSSTVSTTPLPPPPAAAPVVTIAPGDAKVTLTWSAVPDATSYKIYRGETAVVTGAAVGSTSSTTFTNTSLTNGTTYFYQVAGRNAGGDGPRSEVVSATPVATPLAPANLTAVAGDRMVTLAWSPAAGATSYNVLRSTQSGKQPATPIAQGLTTPAFVDTTVVNGPTYYYKVTATNAGGTSPRSNEASASPEAPQPPTDPNVLAAFRFLRQATWGPRPGDVDALVASGNNFGAFLDQQFATGPSDYPNILYSLSTEITQEHFMSLALMGPDQLRQRVAWALHKIWVVSAVEVPRADAIVTYQRVLMAYAFGNYRDLMGAMALNPAMGRYLNMLNSRSQAFTGVPPNENFPRELMQLFVTGIPRLNTDGSIMRDATGAELLVYTEDDVKELARIFTGWTFGDGSPMPADVRSKRAAAPKRTVQENWRVPMEPVAAYHDVGEKLFLGHTFPAGQTPQQDLDQALDVLFNHPNVGPFVARQLIQQLVKSNPTPAYIAAAAAVFNDNGAGVRGDLAALVRAILLHPEARLSNEFSGKLSEPVLFVVSQLRALNADVTDHPFMSDKAEEMGQKVFYPPSVFSYYSPGYRVRGTAGPTGAPMGGPEFQILTSVTALVRANFTGALLGGWFGDDVLFDYTPFTSLAADPAALVDYCVRLFMGTRISPEMRAEIIAAVRVSPSGSPRERARTAIYLTLIAAQTQVDW